MPMGAPPRHMATRKVGRKPLHTTRLASSIESRSRSSAEMNNFSTLRYPTSKRMPWASGDSLLQLMVVVCRRI